MALPKRSEEQKVINDLSATLRDGGAIVQHDVVVGSSSPDLFAVSASGFSNVFEVKAWSPTPANVRRASHLASLYRSASGADNAFVVMPDLARSRPSSGVISPADVPGILALQSAGSSRLKAPSVKGKPSRIIFTAMPFSSKYDDTFYVAMQPAALEIDAECVRVDHADFTGDSVAEIKRLIKASVALIADLSGHRPNVLYELGLADAIVLPTIQVCSTPLEKLPFDVRNNPTIKYDIGQTTRLKTRLIKRLSEIVA